MIPKNTLLRNKVKNLIKDEGNYEEMKVEKMNPDVIQGIYHVRRRLNQMIKKRTSSLLTETAVDLKEAGDLLELLEERLIMDGLDLSDALRSKEELKTKYGSYDKFFSTTDHVDSDTKGFIPFVNRGKAITDGAHTMYIDRNMNHDCF